MQLPSRRAALSEAAHAALAALIALLLIGLAGAAAWPVVVDVGGEDEAFVESFHEPERAGERSFRWTDGDSRLLLPPLPPGAQGVLTLRVQDARPAGAPPATLTVRAGGAELVALTFADDLARTYRLLTPTRARLERALVVGLQGDTAQEAGGGRLLGVAVFEAALAPAGGPRLPALWAAAWSLVLGLGMYLVGRLAGAGRRVSLATAAALAALVALGVAARPLEILPFVQRFAGLSVTGAVTLAAVRLLVPATHERGGLRVAGEQLPIILAVGAWGLLLFQLFLIWDGVGGIAPEPWRLWIVGWLVAALGVGLPLWHALASRLLDDGARRVRHGQIVLACLAAAAAANLALSLAYAYTRQAPDFWILFRGARAWVRGGSLYDLTAVVENHFGHVFKVPPFYGMLFVPAVQTMGGETALLIHRVLNTALIVATALLWLRMWGVRPGWAAAAGVLILFNFRPLVDTLAYGQIDLALLFLLTAALWALRAGRDGAAGALVALGTLFKIYPVVLLAFFVLKGRWRALWGFALGMLVFNGVAVAVMGWNEHWTYVTQVLPNIGGTTSWVENQTVSGFLARLAASPMSATIFEGRALRLAGTALSLLIVLAACALALRPADRRSPAFAVQYGLFLLLMVLAVPAAWMHYQTLLVVTFGALLIHLRERRVALGYAIALGLSFALISYGNQWTFFGGGAAGALAVAGVSYKLYGMVLLLALGAAALLVDRPAGAP
jgi:hypothetical protein